MTRQAARTILCCTVSGLGLWAVAGGFLTHHPKVGWIGAALAAAGALLMFSGPADASNFDGFPPPMASVPATVLRPPVAFQKPATFTVHTLPSGQVVDTCHRLGAIPADLSCENSGTVYIGNPCEYRGDLYAENLCHAAAHLPPNNWPANHPSEDSTR